ncbi:hypothetical protein E2C01_084276 [Portunus trituberculatus]|uniref:Uncharacterized protein n=1 Tax=Portunus trituberculatus TaxID=210409 RepID=A0A5B7J5W1_PORTR|nr:hypothetical protein [Portunus trituberculatus]
MFLSTTTHSPCLHYHYHSYHHQHHHHAVFGRPQLLKVTTTPDLHGTSLHSPMWRLLEHQRRPLTPISSEQQLSLPSTPAHSLPSTRGAAGGPYASCHRLSSPAAGCGVCPYPITAGGRLRAEPERGRRRRASERTRLCVCVCVCVAASTLACMGCKWWCGWG